MTKCGYLIIFVFFIYFVPPVFAKKKPTVISLLTSQKNAECFKIRNICNPNCFARSWFYPLITIEHYFEKSESLSLTHTNFTSFYENTTNAILRYTLEVGPAIYKMYSNPELSLQPDSTTQKQWHIPKIVHKFWLTNPAKPYNIPQEYLNILMKEIPLFDGSWTFIIWVIENDQLKVQTQEFIENVTKLFDQRAKIEIGDITKTPFYDEIKGELWDHIENKRFSAAVTLCKYKITYEFGGVYADMDVQIARNLEPILVGRKMILICKRENFYVDAIYATAKSNVILGTTFEKFLNFVSESQSLGIENSNILILPHIFEKEKIYYQHFKNKKGDDGWTPGDDFKMEGKNKFKNQINLNLSKRFIKNQGIMYYTSELSEDADQSNKALYFNYFDVTTLL